MRVTRRQLRQIIQEVLREDSNPWPKMPPVTTRARGSVDITADNAERLVQNAKIGSRIVMGFEFSGGPREVFARHEDGWHMEGVFSVDEVLGSVQPAYHDGLRIQLEDMEKSELTIPVGMTVNDDIHEDDLFLKRSNRHPGKWIWSIPVDQDRLWRVLEKDLADGVKLSIISDSPPATVYETTRS